MQRAILKTINEKELVHMTMAFAAPRGLGNGKDGWRIWNAARQFRGLVRDQHPAGLLVNWYLQEGLHVHQFQRWMQSRHEEVYELNKDLLQEDPLDQDEEWTFSFRCVSHCASNAIKWGLAHETDADMLGNLAIATMALQNSSQELMKVPMSSCRDESSSRRPMTTLRLVHAFGKPLEFGKTFYLIF